MARTIRNAKLDTRSARAKLAPRREPYWCAIAPGRHLGYRRLGAQGGTWIAKLRTPGVGRWIRSLDGVADDVMDANGRDVLTFAMAQERARSWFVEQERADQPVAPAPAAYTVTEALDAYRAWLAKHRKPTATRDLDAVRRAHIPATLGQTELARLTAS